MSWIVAVTRPNQEAVASDNLKRQGYEHYCPRFLQTRPNKTPLARPLFPRYIFIFIDTVWYSLLGTRGISQILMSDIGPQSISATIIENIKQKEDKAGFVQLAPVPKFLNGTKVTATKGPLTGQVLIYDGMTAHERCNVLVGLMGRQVHVSIEEKVLVAA